MANNNMHKILVDNGSSVDILYYQAFQKMGLKDSDLKPSPNPVYGFTGDIVTPMGVVSLLMTVGEYPRQSCDGRLPSDRSVIDFQRSARLTILKSIEGGHQYLSFVDEVPYPKRHGASAGKSG